ncbi:hypothetical protein C3991_01618 [Escherichia coli]|nr:hypothetical protein C3991_01618 [Escherichia coli]
MFQCKICEQFSDILLLYLVGDMNLSTIVLNEPVAY